MGFHPVLRYGLPRSSETWSHLENLDRMPSAVEAANIGKMLELFQNRQHYTKYPLFYVVCKALTIDSPLAAAVFSGAIFSIMPLLAYLLAGRFMEELEAFVAAILLCISAAFVYTMNFFSGGEPLAFAILLLSIYVYLRYRPAYALPLLLPVVLLHPFTSVFLWSTLVLMGVFDKPVSRIEAAACTGVYTAALIGWLGFQVSEGLPLGNMVSSSVEYTVVFLLLAGSTAISILISLGRERIGMDEKLAHLTGLVRELLPRIILGLEIVLVLVFTTAGIMGTEKSLTPQLLLYYSPTMALIAVVGLRREKVDPLTTSLTISFLVLMVSGLFVFPEVLPTYRLAPYGALCLVLLAAPVIRDRRMRIAVPIIAIGIGATVYPGATFYFGFDEQYYPSEMSALDRIGDLMEGPIFTDVRMEDLVRYRFNTELVIPGKPSAELPRGTLALVTRNMRETGLYPPGAEWYRAPFHLDLEPLELGSDRIYENGQVELHRVASDRVYLEEARE